MQSQKLKKYLILKFKIISRTSFVFMIAFMVYEWRAYIDVRYEDTYPKKKDKTKSYSQSFQARFLISL